MIVIDVGCAEYANHPGDVSIGPLIRRFRPALLLGFDPSAEAAMYEVDDTIVVISPEAAWLHDGEIGYDDSVDGVQRTSGPDVGPGRVPCFDIVALIASHASTEIVLKLDCEGAEYPLLEAIHDAGVDSLLELVLVEWHNPRRWRARRRLVAALRCPVETWEHE